MDRTSGANYIVVGGKRQFTDGPPASTVEEVFLNGVQEELVGLIVAAGLTPNAADVTQLLQAVITPGGVQTLTNKTLVNPLLSIDVISEFTTGVGVTVDSCLIKDGKAADSDKCDGAHAAVASAADKIPIADASGQLGYAWMPIGTEIQSDSAVYSAYLSDNTAIPYDNTIPQIGEGAQFLSLAFTPKLASSVIEIFAVGSVSIANASVVVALFNGNANAIKATPKTMDSGDYEGPLVLLHRYSPGSVNPITFTLRAGTSNVANPYTLNGGGTASGSKLGASNGWVIVVREKRA